MKIEFIKHPFVYTDSGERIEIGEIIGNPKVGSELELENGKYKVMANTSDTECVGGVCPVK